jgi:hypothetical protein
LSSNSRIEPKRRIENCYLPHARVSAYLKKKLDLEVKRKQLIHAGEKLSEKEDKERRSLDTEKVEILNAYIFPSMANIVKFLEYSQEENLRDVFEEDIKELFFGKSWLKNGHPYPVFMRFLLAAVGWKPENEGKDKGNMMRLDRTAKLTDFRLALLRDLYKVIELVAVLSGPHYVFDDDSYANVVIQDFVRLGIWIKLLTRNADIGDFDVTTVRRRALF